MLIKCIDGFTRQFGAPADWDGKDMSCGVLPVLDVQTAEGNFMFSAWEPTPPELEALNKGANIILGVRGAVHPVVSVQVAADITPTEKHPDDIAVAQFADAMKAKLADARAKGRSGWQECDPAELSYMLREHVEKGDPRDVANFCMFLWSLGKPIGDTVLPISGRTLPPPQEGQALPVADEREALEEADALTVRIEAFYDGADMFGWARVREKVRAALRQASEEAHPAHGAIAWEAATPVYTKYITDARYQKLHPGFKPWYKPYRCSQCLASNEDNKCAGT